MTLRTVPLALLAAALATNAAAPGADDPNAALKRAIVDRYAENAYRLYQEIERRAVEMDERISAFLARPVPETLAAAREAWVHAREAYGESEVYRFYGGPIDDPRTGTEPLINAWPLDESFLDYVAGANDAGIINQPERYPNLDGPILEILNQRGGETNVTTGWHAIEFLLWGQDRSADGPGDRPYTDYVIGTGRNAERRRRVLSALSALLLHHLHALTRAWEPGTDNYRASFVADEPERSLRKMLTGAAVFSAFELSGERLAVAYETQDQEEEHSCFSDTTDLDLLHGELGVVAVFDGGLGETAGPGLRDLARAASPGEARDVEQRLDHALEAVRAIPPPFDNAIRGPDDAPGREAVLRALTALEDQAQALAALGEALGMTIPMRPSG